MKIEIYLNSSSIDDCKEILKILKNYKNDLSIEIKIYKNKNDYLNYDSVVGLSNSINYLNKFKQEEKMASILPIKIVEEPLKKGMKCKDSLADKLPESIFPL